MSFPPELWREVISLATYTPTCFDTSDNPDTWNPVTGDLIEQYGYNLHTKRALAFVSKQFHQITLEFLCDIIIICYMDYDPAIGMTCRKLGRLTPLIPYLHTTQHLLVDSVNIRNFNDVAQSLVQILRQCHNLQGLHLSFPRECVDEVGNAQLELHEISMQTQIANAVCPGLKFLSISRKVWGNMYTTLLNRVSLTLRAHGLVGLVRKSGQVGGTMATHHPEEILLPELNSFHLSISNSSKFSFSKFKMSSLTYLAIGIPSPRNILTEIFESAKDSILSLRFDGRCAVDDDVLSIALRASHLQFLEYRIDRPVEPRSVVWLSDGLHHATLREMSIGYSLDPSPFGTADSDDIVRDHFHPISKRKFPMLRTVTVAPMVGWGPHDVLGVYNLEDGKRLEDGDNVRSMKLYFRGPRD